MSDILSLDYQSSWEEFQRNERVKELPLRIRIGLRDNYYKPENPVHEALESLRSELGSTPELKIDWGKLWSEISTEFPDPATFVPSISRVAIAFIGAVETCITGAAEDWGDTLLDRMKAQDKSVLELYLLVDPTVVSVKALYLAQNASLALKLPKAGPGTYNAISKTSIVPQLMGIFDNVRAEEWVNAGIDDVKIPQLDSKTLGGAAVQSAVEKFPDVHATPRPDVLMEKPPYYATIRTGQRLEISCSHQKTLDFLATYLENHASPHPTHVAPNKMWKVERCDSYFGNGLVFDKVTVEEGRSNWGVTPTPMLVLSLLQGTLGYTVEYLDGSCWVLKRDTKFASR